jgi:hypothetical protein
MLRLSSHREAVYDYAIYGPGLDISEETLQCWSIAMFAGSTVVIVVLAIPLPRQARVSPHESETRIELSMTGTVFVGRFP